MKKGLIFPLLFILIFISGWADHWEGIRDGAKDIRSVRSEFIQEKHMEILSKPLISKGVIYYKSPNFLRWEYQSPIRSILLMNEGETKRFVKKDGKLIQDYSPNLMSMQVVLDEISMWLKGHFDENPNFTAELNPGRRIELVPKEEAMAKFIQKIELFLSDEPGMIRKVKISESETSFTELIFENTVLNPDLDNILFREIS